MGDVITFPIWRRRAHVCLSWDHAWDQYRIEAVGRQSCRGSLEWCDTYDEAMDRLIGMGERFCLPMLDTADSGVVA